MGCQEAPKARAAVAAAFAGRRGSGPGAGATDATTERIASQHAPATADWRPE